MWNNCETNVFLFETATTGDNLLCIDKLYKHFFCLYSILGFFYISINFLNYVFFYF